jgi:hypothetical protein
MTDEGLADVEAANPFRLPRLHPEIGSAISLQASITITCGDGVSRSGE